MNYKFFLYSTAFLIFFASCTNDSTNDLVNDEPIAGDVKYTQNVKSIIDANCVVCHAATPVNGAPMSLTTYAQVKEAVENRGLLDRITRDNGESGLMPNGGPKLPQATIDVVLQWNADGLQE
jgi:uncharacterized membrane protein